MSSETHQYRHYRHDLHDYARSSQGAPFTWSRHHRRVDQRLIRGNFGLACFYLALLLVAPAGVGPGDAKLALAVGTMLGWYGWPELFAGTFCAFLAGGSDAM